MTYIIHKSNLCVLPMQKYFYTKVLTTMKTTALSVTQIEFPSVTFCSPGINVINIMTSLKF